MDIKKITTNRGVYVILLILIVLSSLVLFNLLNKNQNFDNETLTSRRFSGSMTIDDHSLITMEVYFDGFGNITGSIIYSNDTLSYDGDYVCLGTSVQFSFIPEETTYQFTFLGNLLSDNTIITGDVEFKKSTTEVFNGTFYLSLI